MKKIHWLIPVLTFAVFCIIFATTSFQDGGDDAAYARIAQTTPFYEHLINQYLGWSGRLSSELFAYLVNGPFYRLWIPLNSVMVTAGLFYLYSSFKSYSTRRLILGIGSLSLIPLSVIEPAIIWRTGSVNYLWPCVFGLITFFPFIKLFKKTPELSRNEVVLAGITGVFAALGSEQVAVTLSLAIFLVVTYRRITKQSVPLSLWIIASVVWTATIGLLIAPGNTTRFQVEEKTNFPDFSELSVINRVSISLYWVVNKMINVLWPLLATAVIISAWLQNNKRSVFRLVGIVIGSVFIIGKLVWGNIEVVPLTSGTLFSLLRLLPYLLIILLFALLLANVLYRFRISVRVLPPLIVVGLVFLNLFLITLSPTLDVSGNRTLFLPAVLMVVLIMMLLQVGTKKRES